MWILAMETTGLMASVAIINEDSAIRELVGEKGYNHLTSLIPMTKTLLEENGLIPQDISAVSASVGPGSFTGIRIGVSSARAFSQSLEIPCIAIPTLQTFLYNHKLSHHDKISCDKEAKLVCPILDARRDQLYGAVFYEGRVLVEEGAYSLSDYLERIKNLDKKVFKNAIFYGDGITRYGQTIESWAIENGIDILFAPEEQRYQRARSGALIAKSRWDEGRVLSYNELLPEYMRLAEAEQKLKAGAIHV
jgi:tRNA threonylcarbamoyladenosine biosynthesis protein TsaB